MLLHLPDPASPKPSATAASPTGDSPWFRAAKAGDLDNLRAMIVQGADIEARCEYLDTALHHAALLSSPDCARLLIDAGADVDARQSCGWTPAMLAALTPNGAPVIAALAAAGADLDARQDNGSTAAIFAAGGVGRPDCLAQLIASGCSLLLVDDKGHNALDHARGSAANHGSRACLDMILQEISVRERAALDRSVGETLAPASTPLPRTSL